MKKLVIFIIILGAFAALVIWKKVDSGHEALSVNSEPVTQEVLSDSILASGNLIFNTQIPSDVKTVDFVLVFEKAGEVHIQARVDDGSLDESGADDHSQH